MPKLPELRALIQNALVNGGWTITHDPYMPPPLCERNFEQYPDEIPFAADRGEEKIALGLSGFESRSDLDPLYVDMGQFAHYRSLMNQADPDRALLLAVAANRFDSLWQDPFIATGTEGLELRFAVYDPEDGRLLRRTP